MIGYEEIFAVVGIILSVILIKKKNRIGVILLTYWCSESLYVNSFFVRGIISSLLFLVTVILLSLSIIMFNKQFWRRGL